MSGTRRRPPLAVIQGGKGSAMKLDWSDYGALADALAAAHPTIDRIGLSRDDIRRLVLALPEFDDAPEPDDPEMLDAVIYAWIALDAEGEENHPDD